MKRFVLALGLIGLMATPADAGRHQETNTFVRGKSKFSQTATTSRNSKGQWRFQSTRLRLPLSSGAKTQVHISKRGITFSYGKIKYQIKNKDGQLAIKVTNNKGKKLTGGALTVAKTTMLKRAREALTTAKYSWPDKNPNNPARAEPKEGTRHSYQVTVFKSLLTILNKTANPKNNHSYKWVPPATIAKENYKSLLETLKITKGQVFLPVQ